MPPSARLVISPILAPYWTFIRTKMSLRGSGDRVRRAGEISYDYTSTVLLR
jgi:hypothetical protein